jgi:septal ring factor EnvC (AmiA/AmiB activator)
VDNTNAERQRRYIARLKAAAARPDAETAALKQELARAKAQIEKLTLQVQQHAAKPKRPPLPPDEARERLIKSLTTQNRNLREQLSRVQHGAYMSFKSLAAIAKCLHPDTRRQTSEAEFDKACRLFTEWKANMDKSRRH